MSMSVVINAYDLLSAIDFFEERIYGAADNGYVREFCAILLLCLGYFFGISAREDDVFALRGEFFNYRNARVDRCAGDKYTFHFPTSKK